VQRFARARPFGDTRGCSRSEACASCSLARRRAACRPSARRLAPEDERSGIERLGPLDASETGEDRVSRRDPHFGDPFVRACGVDSSARSIEQPTSDIPVASSEALACRIVFAIDARARRPPRSVPRGPRERRALLRPEMPSIVRSFSATARTEARTDCGAFIETRRSRDEDCRSSNESVPLSPRAAFGACALPVPIAFAMGDPLVTRPPSTRLLPRPSFRPVRCRGRASLSPKTTYRLLQYDDARAPTAGRRILERGEGRRVPHLRSLFADPCGPTRATSHEIHMHPKMHGLRGPADPSEGSRAFQHPNPLLEPTAHLVVVCTSA